MRKLMMGMLLALAAGVARAQQPGDAGIGDPYFPTVGNGGYDVQHYTIDLSADVEANVVDATVMIDAQATQALSAFNLDFEGFDIGEITVDGQAAGYERDGRELVITPDAPLAEGDAFTVAVTYTGEPGAGVESEGLPTFAEGWTNYGDGVFVASEPVGAARWFPSNDHPLDKATFTFRITVPEAYVVAANGLLQETIEAGDHVTYVWESAYPMATYLATVSIGDFAVQETEGPGGLPIRNYFPADRAERGAEVFARQPEMIEFFSDLFGPYPFEAYGTVVADTGLGFALETQTLSLFGSDVLASFSFGMTADEVISHELSHQWFGDSVTIARWQDIWLNEGFATYAQALWIEHTEGRAALDEYMSGIYAIIAEPAFALGDVVVPGKPPADDLFNTSVYLRGAWTLHALRLRVGDEAFFEILRTYYDRYQYGNVTTHSFIAVAEEISGEELRAFFNSWLYESRVPRVAGLLEAE